MYKVRIVLYSLVVMINFALNAAPRVVLKEVLPIENVWSIYISRNGKMAGIRFKGKEDLSEIVQLQNIGDAQIRDTETWHIIKDFKNVRMLYLSPDTKLVIVVYGDSFTQIIDLEQNVVVKEFHQVWNVHFSPNGKCVSIVFDTNTQILAVENWQVIQEFKNTAHIWQEFSHDNKNIFVAFADDTAQIINIESGQIIHSFTGIAQYGVSFSADNKYVAVSYTNNTAALLTTDNWDIVHTFKDIKFLHFDAYGRTLWGAFVGNTFKRIDIETGNILLEKPNAIFWSISPNGNYVWIIFEDMSVQVIDIETGDVLIKDIKSVEECSFSPIRNEIVMALSHQVRVYEFKDDEK